MVTRHVFIFVNPTSGSNQAQNLLNPKVSQIVIMCPTPVHVHFYNSKTNTPKNHAGFLMLKQVVEDMKNLSKTRTNKECLDEEKKNCIITIAAGGDGTVMHIINQIFAYNIDSTYVTFGVLPYGTGNDFAKAFGWKNANISNVFNKNLKRLRELVFQWINCPVVYHDLWDIIITKHPQGTIQKIDPVSRSKRLVLSKVDTATFDHNTTKNDENEENELKLKMSNYFSTGIESRVGLGFERHRTRLEKLNKSCYVLESLKKTFFKKKLVINSQVVDLSEIIKRNETTEEYKEIFSQLPDSMVQLIKSGSIIITNIPSFASGVNVWDNARHWALTCAPDPDVMKTKQKIGDGILEMTTFKGLMSLGLERVLKGQGKRLAQGTGPYRLRFHDTIYSNSIKNCERIYFQVDGDFFVGTLLKEVRIKLWKKVKVISQNKALRHKQ
ncbi:diacylglycerol kinase theta-like [Hylaeus volcanicus]|uniref:diacylglycerol kinase theta-like n=1 Tax=Hylaeus volcanicus TaxID=313075 RepID=UPI0023B83106|nr:diacylglycerol kinase theta-like [Hylaeus volcanicus]